MKYLESSIIYLILGIIFGISAPFFQWYMHFGFRLLFLVAAAWVLVVGAFYIRKQLGLSLVAHKIGIAMLVAIAVVQIGLLSRANNTQHTDKQDSTQRIAADSELKALEQTLPDSSAVQQTNK